MAETVQLREHATALIKYLAQESLHARLKVAFVVVWEQHVAQLSQNLSKHADFASEGFNLRFCMFVVASSLYDGFGKLGRDRYEIDDGRCLPYTGHGGPSSSAGSLS